MEQNFIKNTSIKNIKTDKIKIFLVPSQELNDENKQKILDYSLSIDKFENLLSKCLQEFNKEKTHQNSFKLYSTENKNLKLFNDGSCFSYKLLNINFKKLSFLSEDLTTFLVETNNEQIQNDEFPGLYSYNIIDTHNEIVFKLSDYINLVFTNCIMQNRKNKYFVHFEIKPKNIESEHLGSLEKDVRKYISKILIL